MDPHRQTVTATAAPAVIGPYSHAVRAAGELLFCSGQIPLDSASGELVGESAGEQARRCLENLQAVCAAAGTTLARAVRVTVYVTDLARFAEVNEVYATFFPADPPARVTVGVAALPRGALVEIDAVVAVGAAPADAADAAGAGATTSAAPPAAAAVPTLTSPPGPAPSPPGTPPPTAAGAVYHVELRHFPRNVCRFNLSAAELQTAVLTPWAADRPFEFGDVRWDPRHARLTVLEGPRLAPGELTMGRGWSAAQRQGRDVTAELLA
jgi:2-iminobutanoate/2-iminopropanoate deaminase